MPHTDSWLDQNTYHHQDFDDLNELIDLKQKQQLQISVVIPTLNEERNIGDVVRVIRGMLQERHPLVDELIVVDSGSTDRTGDRAMAAGARFICAAEIRPELGEQTGKGENLWKSLSVTQGDLICFIDADIQNMHPRFIYGLIGPLLRNEHLQYIKGFYERPMNSGSRVLPNQGGRVTELLVRPLFALFYPELTRFCQPLAGEYAARRSTLEKLPFPCGYGVESAHLIDCLREIGISAMAQCDLDERIHRNRSLRDLSHTSHEILQAILPRLERDGHLSALQIRSQEIWHLDSTITGLEFDKETIACHERPPFEHLRNPAEDLDRT